MEAVAWMMVGSALTVVLAFFAILIVKGARMWIGALNERIKKGEKAHGNISSVNAWSNELEYWTKRVERIEILSERAIKRGTTEWPTYAIVFHDEIDVYDAVEFGKPIGKRQKDNLLIITWIGIEETSNWACIGDGEYVSGGWTTTGVKQPSISGFVTYTSEDEAR